MSALAELDAALRGRRLAAVHECLTRHYPHDPNLPWALSVVHWYLGAAALPVGFRVTGDTPAAARERLCADHAMGLVRMRAAAPAGGVGPRVAGLAYDCLGDSFAPAGWGLAMTLNQALLRQLRPRRRAAVLVTMRDDGLTMLEWVAHYRQLGFDRIFVFSNDNEDGSDALLAALAAAGLVTWISQTTAPTASPQIRAYEYSLHMLDELRDFAWVLYVDSDEFLMLDPPYDHAIHRFLDAVEALDPAVAAVRLHWRWYVSGDRLAWSPAPLLSRFVHARRHDYCKSLIRLAAAMSMRQVHFPETDRPAMAVDGGLRAVPLTEIAVAGGDEGARLNHYWHKSFAEFLLKKRRGDRVDAPNHRSYRRALDLFFTWNEAETAANAVPPPADLLARVETELSALRADPAIAAAERHCQERFHELVARYCAPETVEAFYSRAKAEARRPGEVPAG